MNLTSPPDSCVLNLPLLVLLTDTCCRFFAGGLAAGHFHPEGLKQSIVLQVIGYPGGLRFRCRVKAAGSDNAPVTDIMMGTQQVFQGSVNFHGEPVFAASQVFFYTELVGRRKDLSRFLSVYIYHRKRPVPITKDHFGHFMPARCYHGCVSKRRTVEGVTLLFPGTVAVFHLFCYQPSLIKSNHIKRTFQVDR